MWEETQEDPGTSADHSEGLAYGLASSCGENVFFSFSTELENQ